MAIEIKNSTNTQILINLASQRQDELKNVSIQIATGDKYTDYKGFAVDSNVERFISLNQMSASTNSFIQSNNIINSKITTINQAVDQLQGIAADLTQLIAQSRNSASSDDIPLETIGQSMLDDIAGRLNVKFDGNYLFSGTKTDTMPVQNIHSDILGTDDVPTATYYHGDSVYASIKISSSQTLTYGVNANDEAFKQLIGAVQLAMRGHSEGDADTMQAAMDMANEAVSSLASVRAQLGTSQKNIANANATHSDVKLMTGQNLIEVSQTDVVEATTRMSELQATIQATYLAFQRLSELRLSNYL
ncbi:MAG: flagellar hook-associated protein FlgL [Rickettsiaceae bacterium]|jgi:flagellar hook-associated protein 3 FlgL|nr:flagellar hook-associated protein FlgL [Rickettsiaceae bacterium]